MLYRGGAGPVRGEVSRETWRFAPLTDPFEAPHSDERRLPGRSDQWRSRQLRARWCWRDCTSLTRLLTFHGKRQRYERWIKASTGTPHRVEPVRDLVTTVWTATASKVSRGSLISQQRRLPVCATSEERQ